MTEPATNGAETNGAGTEPPITVVHDTVRSRYELREGDRVIGYTQYHLDGGGLGDSGELVFDHTEVDRAYSGRGLGSRLIGSALDDVRSRGGRVVPICGLVAAYVDKHPEYADLVD